MSGDRLGGDTGASLAEVLVAIVLLGFGFVAILGALGTTITSSDRHESHAEAGVLLVSAAEVVRAVPFDADCAGYEAAVQPLAPAGWTIEIAACDEPQGQTLQHLRLTATSPDGRVTDHLTVAKSELTSG